MMQNREIMMTMFPDLINDNIIEPIDDYPLSLRKMLSSIAPQNCDKEPIIVVLTPGSYNSAYYEHSFLADLMGVELVQGTDLFVDESITYMKTTRGPEKIDIIYRRIDDKFLDPITFDSSSLIGIPGLFDSYKSGNVNICSAPGSGIADDKAIYSYIPDIIKFYLGEEPILDNVKTWRCCEEDAKKYVLNNLNKLVVKEVHGSGGYGLLIGSKSSKKEIEVFRKKILLNPANYIAQPVLELSSVPIFDKKKLSPRHVDLRPFCLVGANKTKLVDGGLTRVALNQGSLVVNSSQGGGVKDTWILNE